MLTAGLYPNLAQPRASSLEIKNVVYLEHFNLHFEFLF